MSVPQNLEEIQKRTWLNISEAAMYMHATRWYVKELCRKHRIPFARLGKRFVLKRQDCDAHIERLTEVETTEEVQHG